MIQVAVLTVSDRSSRGERPDAGGPVIQEFVRDVLKWSVAHTAIVPDDAPQICSQLVEWCDEKKVNLILTTGGTMASRRHGDAVSVELSGDALA